MTRERRSFVFINVIHLLCFGVGTFFLSTSLHAQETVTQVEPESAPPQTDADTKANEEAASQDESTQAAEAESAATQQNVAETESATQDAVVETEPAETVQVVGAPSVQNTYTNADFELMPEQPKQRPRKGLMIAGWSVLGGGYLFSLAVGLLVLAQDDDPGTTCLNCDEVGPKMMIPLVGPFIALPDADGADGKAVSAILGVVQFTGLTLGIVGTALYVVRKKQYYAENKNPYLPRVGVAYTGRSEDSPILQLGWSF